MTEQSTAVRKLSDGKWNVEDICAITGLSEQTVKSTPNAALEGMIQTKMEAEQAKQEAESAKAQAAKRTPARKSDKEKNLNKLRKFLSGAEPTESSLIMAEVVLAPWRGAKDIKAEIAPDHSRTFSTPVHDAKLMLNILMEMDLLDRDYVAQLEELAG